MGNANGLMAYAIIPHMLRTTPDLSQSYNPIPKTYKSKKPPKRLHAGEKTKEWEDAREDLKKIFAEWNITACELRLKGCWKDNFLTFAHLAKRRKLTKEDLHIAVLCCINCHSAVEYMPAEKMREILQAAIDRRGHI